MKSIIIIVFFFTTFSLFSSDIAIKLLEKSYKQLNQEIVECQKEEKRIFKSNSDLEDHLTLRIKIKKLYETRQELEEMLQQLINDYEKNNVKNNQNAIVVSEDPIEQISHNGKDVKPSKIDKKKVSPNNQNNSTNQQDTHNVNTGNNSDIIKTNSISGKEVLTIIVPNPVKPGKLFTYIIKPPKHYKQPKIKWIRYQSNLDTPAGISPTTFSGRLVPDADIERQQNTWIAAYVIDLATPGSGVKGEFFFTINGEKIEEKMGLKVPSKMISGRSASFEIQVPPGFKRPYSVLVKSFGGKHLIVNWSTTSLSGTLRAWGDGNADNILTVGISARVYDDTGRIGYIRKNITIVEPTQEDLDKTPMEKPPAWYEKAANFTWDATKGTGKVAVAVLKGTGQAMKAIGDGAKNRNIYSSGNNYNNSANDPISGTWKVYCHPLKSNQKDWQMKVTFSLTKVKFKELYGRVVGPDGSGTWQYNKSGHKKIAIKGLFNFTYKNKKYSFRAIGTVVGNKIIKGYSQGAIHSALRWSAIKIK